MDFTIKPKIDKDFILSRISQEQIFCYYLRLNQIGKNLIVNVTRKDKHPTCGFYRTPSNVLIMHDFATGEKLNCFNLVSKLYNCDYWKSLEIIANDFSLYKIKGLPKNRGKIIKNHPKIEDKEMSKIQIEVQDFSDLELKWWGKYGITLDILKKFNVYSCKYVFLNDQVFAKSQQHCPIFGYYGKKYHGLELWRCYFPKRTSYRFITNWPSKKIQGYDQLPKNGKLLVITKSMKDTMCLYSLGISSCSPNSETQFISDTILEDLKKRFKYIVVLFDNDQTGISFMKRQKEKYPELIYTWIPRKYGAKDISDFYKIYGRKKTQELIKEFLIWLKNRKNQT